MNIRPKNILKFAGGGQWYSGLQDYDTSKYLTQYDTSRLVNGDINARLNQDLKTGTNSDAWLPWQSNISGYDQGRYTPTTGHGAFGKDKEHYNYTLGVEGQNYYKQFGNDLLDEQGNFTDTGIAWAKAVDALLPPGSKAGFFERDKNNNIVLDENGKPKVRSSWTTTYNDAHGLNGGRTWNNLRDYVKHVRNDQILGARHNVFLKKGQRYFYTDDQGVKHFVSPEDAKKFTISKDPIEQGWDGTTYWDDYEITAPQAGTNPQDPVDPTKKAELPVGHREGGYNFDWSKLGEGLKKYMPDLLEVSRLAGTLASNSRVYDAKLKGIRPNLQQTYLTHRQVVGDEATKQAYYKRAAAGQTKAGRAFTSDADRQMAYMMEAKRVGDDLRAQGDLADNQEIRRTSDESNQHQWDNTRRRTEVANANRLALNQANAARQDLIAQKHAANWSSWNNYLSSIEHRIRQKEAKNDAIRDQIKLLTYQNNLINDDSYAAARKALKDALVAANYDTSDPKVLAAKKNLENLTYQKEKAYYESTLLAKSGIKITHKRKDDLLYKTARDVVEHFRRMSKMSDDSTQRSRTKPIKLSPHPNSAARKMQQGGVAPFTVFTPVTLGGETTTSSQVTDSARSSKKSDKKNNILDVIKDLFGKVDGLYSDTTAVYDSMRKFLATSSVFGDELSTDDIASMYLQQMQQITLLKRNKEAFDQAKELATKNDALNEFAVDYSGRIIVQDTKDGELKLKSWREVKEAEGQYNPLTNSQVLNMRAYSPNMKFNNDILNVVNNGIGVSKIAEFIKNHIPKPGTSEETIEGFTKHESNQIRQGLELLKEAPAGDYKFTKYTKTQQEQANAALRYIASILPNNMKSILNIHADMNGTSVEGMLTSLVSSGLSNNSKLEFDPLTGKAAKKADGSSGDDLDSGKMTPAMAFFAGMGQRHDFLIQNGTTDGLKVQANSMSLLNSSGHNLGASTLLGVKQSMYGGQFDLQSATMGDVKISVNGQNNVLISDGTIYSTELPIDPEAAARGIIKPDLSFLKNIEKADQQLREMGITDRSDPKNIDTINKVYRDNGLPIVYNKDGSGKPILTSQYRRFAMFNGYATEDAFEGDMTFNDGAIEITDSKQLDQFESMMKSVSGNDKYKLDRGYGIFGGGTNVYQGVIYIPMITDTNSALAGTGYKAPIDTYMEIDRLQQQRDNALQMGYNSPQGNASILK